MPLSTIGDRRKDLFDKLLELRAYDAAALTATANGTALSIDATKIIAYEAICNIAAYTGYDAGTAEWALKIEVSADDSTYVAVTPDTVIDGTAQELRFALSGAAVNDVVADAIYVRVVATKTGSPGNLTFGAYLSPV